MLVSLDHIVHLMHMNNITATLLMSQAADRMAKEAARSQPHSVPDATRWQSSLPYLPRQVTENRARVTAQWVAAHVRPELRYHPPGGSGQRRRLLRRAPKSVAGRFYQLLS